MKKLVILLFCFFVSTGRFLLAENPPFLTVKAHWADSVLNRLTLDEKIGQLIMVTIRPGQEDNQEDFVRDQIKKNRVGGVLFLKSSPSELASLANEFQQISPTPLFIALDAENGLSFRMDSVVEYPQMIALGAVSADTLIYRMGLEIAEQCKALGINLDFAPVGDVNQDPLNPVINYRSFGENPDRVARKSWIMAKGLQDGNLFVTLKHFPGHGNTSTDSHLALPAIQENYQQLDTTDFVPFKTCIDSGINGIMSAHIQIAEVDDSGRPATLSKKIMTGILRDSLGFSGLVFSDGMNMKGITLTFNEGEAAVEAFKAGVDVLEFVLNPSKVVQAVKKALRKGYLTEDEITAKCRRVLMAKEWVGLDHYQPVLLSGLHERLNKPDYELTSRLLTEQSLTVFKNENSLLPLQRLDTLKIATFSIGDAANSEFQNGLDRYIPTDHFTLGSADSIPLLVKILTELKNYNLVIAGIHGTRLLPGRENRYAVSDIQIAAVDSICRLNKTVLVFFSNPYSIPFFQGIENSEAALVTYGESDDSQDLASQLIFGAIGAKGILPVTISDKFRSGSGILFSPVGRLGYTIPQEEGFDPGLLTFKIDSSVTSAIHGRMFPGCQVLVAKNGKIVFQKAYGYMTYDSIEPVVENDLYDWASITKITGPLPLLMKLYQDSVVHLDVPFSTYWEPFKRSNKSKITLREILAHQARLKPEIFFYKELVLENEKGLKRVFRERPTAEFSVRVSDNLYVNKDVKQKLFDEVSKSDLLKSKKYVYSDMGFYLFPDLITRLTGVSYEQYLIHNFLLPLGACSVTYNPYIHYPLWRIAPTEQDDFFRKGLIRGFVHDENAALMGGISGHAGLFGTANDMAKIMQFYLQKGYYGDFRFLNPGTVDEFTRVQYPGNDNRRGLGFDKPYIDNKSRQVDDAYPARGVSRQCFGHSGFTGTFAWADPRDQLLFIFLTNRVYPTRENRSLIDSNFRPRLFQTIIDCEGTFSPKSY